MSETVNFFSADVAIRRVSDGTMRIYRSNHETREDDGSFADYIWAEGNFGCDCNRFDFFERAGGREPDEDEGECGENGYVIEWIKDVETGEVLYSEA